MRFAPGHRYPPVPTPDFLTPDLPGITDLIKRQVQNLPLSTFERLDAGDILFVDTSHTVKTGGDVTWIYNQILPRLRPGVVVHLHDIFLPRDYPKEWVSDGWGWNEQYLVQSFLVFNRGYEILAGSSFLLDQHRAELTRAFPDLPQYADRGGSALWIRRTSE